MGVKGIYGLSGSGIDVESMVKVGMMTKQSEYDKMYKKETKDGWIKSAYSDFYTSMYTFKNTTMSNYKMQSTMNAMTASSSDSSYVTATANGAAASMSHTVSVSSVAENSYLLSAEAVTRQNTTSSSSLYLKDVLFSGMTIASNSTTDSDGNTTVSDDTTYYLNGDTTSTVKGSDTALSFKISDGVNGDKTISYTYNDLYNGKTLNDLASSISKSGANITAGYDSTNDAFSLYNKSGGAANTISITLGDSTTAGSSNAATLLNNLHLMISSGSATSNADSTITSNLSYQSTDTTTTAGKELSFSVGDTNTVYGKNGSATIDGKTYATTSNKITASNVTYTLLQATSSSQTVTVTQDTDSIIKSVKQFVSDYNTMLDSLNDKIYETQYSDYEPLTKSQEASMTSDQITKWNEKAKSGLLYHSTILRNITSSMRTALSTPVDSVDSIYNSASAIGITSSTNKGHITLDEDKLKTALAADPDCVYQIFASDQDSGDSSSYSTKVDFQNTGIANRLYDTMTDALTTISDYAGTSDDTDDQSYLGKLITNLQTKMSDFKTQMDAYETILYNKYDAMETAISTLSSQLNYVTGSSSS